MHDGIGDGAGVDHQRVEAPPAGGDGASQTDGAGAYDEIEHGEMYARTLDLGLHTRHHRTLTMKIATWNVNSIRARLDRLLAWLQRAAPDVVCLQELKVATEEFPV